MCVRVCTNTREREQERERERKREREREREIERAGGRDRCAQKYINCPILMGSSTERDYIYIVTLSRC